MWHCSKMPSKLPNTNDLKKISNIIIFLRKENYNSEILCVELHIIYILQHSKPDKTQKISTNIKHCDQC